MVKDQKSIEKQKRIVNFSIVETLAVELPYHDMPREWHALIAEPSRHGTPLSHQSTSFLIRVCHTSMAHPNHGPLLFCHPKGSQNTLKKI